MRSALILGGRGQSGQAVTRRLVADGWTVTATTSGPAPEPPDRGVNWVTLQRDESTDLAAVLPDGQADLVVDIMAFTPAHAEQLKALGDRVGSAVVMSTLGVYSDPEGRSLDKAEDEHSFPDFPVPVSEDWILQEPGDQNYGRRKVAMELALRDRPSFPITIIRPGAIHGRSSHHLREWYFIKRVLDGRHQVVLPYRGESVFSPTAAANLAELVARAAGQPGNRVLNCVDPDPPTVAQISELVGQLMGWTTERILVDGPPPADHVGDHPWLAPRPFVADMAAAGRELGYRPAVTYPDALADALPWAVQATEGRDWREVFTTLAGYPTDLFDYAAEDAWLATAR